MTSITVQDGKLVLRDGKVGTEQACCCKKCSGPCFSNFDCGEVDLSNNPVNIDCTCARTYEQELFFEPGECRCGCCEETIAIAWPQTRVPGQGDSVDLTCECPETHRHEVGADFPYIFCTKYSDCCADCEPVQLVYEEWFDGSANAINSGVIYRECFAASSSYWFSSGALPAIPLLRCSDVEKVPCSEENPLP